MTNRDLSPVDPESCERENAISRLVRRAYEDPKVVARYTTVGLWPAEEILVAEYFPERARVLDIGCGTGRTSIALAELGLDVVGVDISHTMIDVARVQAAHAGAQVEFRPMDARELSFPDASFDAALFSYNGFELVPGAEGKRRVACEVQRVLADQGVFVFSVHSPFACNRHAWGRLAALARVCAGRWLGVPVREHEWGERFCDLTDEEVKYLQILPAATWFRLLESCGLQVVYWNSRRRLETGTEWSGWGNWESGERFVVAIKTVVANPGCR